ncbi:MAG: PaaI family thioesterase [Burkholderiaceae bacterium]
MPKGERVTGTTYLLHAGARSQVWSIEIHNDRGQLVCISRITMAVINRRCTTSYAHRIRRSLRIRT